MEQIVIKSNNLDVMIGHISSRPNIKKILFVIYKSGAGNQAIRKLIDHLSLQYLVRSIFFSSPLFCIQDLESMVQEIGKSFIPDLIIAIGGGSVLDAAKCLKYIFMTNTQVSEILHIRNHNIQNGNHPVFFAAPTTAGTGSEATTFGVIYHLQLKYNVESDFLLPDLVFFIPDLLCTVKPHVKAIAMFDALSQAIESLWSIRSTTESIGYAQTALRKIYNILPFFEEPNNTAAIIEMQDAAYLAGKAINISKTTLAHALSYRLTAVHSVPHGLAVFLNLPVVWEFNRLCSGDDCSDPQGVDYLGGVMNLICTIFKTASQEMPEYFREILRQLNFLPYLRDYINFDDYRKIVDEASGNSQRTGNNPRRFDKEILLQIATKQFSDPEAGCR